MCRSEHVGKACRAMNGELVSIKDVKELKEILNVIHKFLLIEKKPEAVLAQMPPGIENGYNNGNMHICGLACQVTYDKNERLQECKIAFLLKQPGTDPFCHLYDSEGVLSYVTNEIDGSLQNIHFCKNETIYWN